MKRFDFEAFDRKLDAELLADEAILAEEKKWLDYVDVIGDLAISEVETPPNQYL